jgi:transposase-like protein
MRKRRLTEEEILRVLHDPESGDSVAAICRQQGSNRYTIDVRRNKYVQELPELAELQQLREENVKLRSLVIKLNTDRQILKDVLGKRP